MSINIGERIRHLRIYRKMSQSELVEGICSVAYLSRIENGKTKPSNNFLKKVSDKLDINFQMLTNQNIESIQNEIEEILFRVEKEDKTLSKEEESLLKMVLLDFIHPQLLIRVFTTLLSELIDKRSMIKADKLYESYIKLIDLKGVYKLEPNYVKKTYLRFHATLGSFFYIKQDFNQSNYHYSIAETLISEPDSLESAKLYYNISLAKQRVLEDTTIALYYSKRSYDIFKRENDIENLINVLITMGVQYRLLLKYDKSLEIFKKAQTYLVKYKLKRDRTLSTMITYNMGRVYQRLKKYNEAILYFNDSYNNTENDIHKTYILKGLLEIKLKRKEWLDAKNLLNETFKLVKKHQLTYIETELHFIKAIIYKDRGDYLNYEKCIKHAIEQAKIKGYTSMIKKAAKELAGYYYELRFYKKSSEYYFIALNTPDKKSI